MSESETQGAGTRPASWTCRARSGSSLQEKVCLLTLEWRGHRARKPLAKSRSSLENLPHNLHFNRPFPETGQQFGDQSPRLVPTAGPWRIRGHPKSGASQWGECSSDQEL